MAEPIIQMTDLRRSFVVRDKAGRVRRARRVVHAVDGITATIEAGQSCGYIGANGAGKSTTIKMLSGILVPTSGQVRTCGLDPVPNRRALARARGLNATLTALVRGATGPSAQATGGLKLRR